nr:NADH dehydrogenase subunit 6 [Gonostoma atlanticum]
MSYFVCFLLFGLMAGLVGVASNPAPYFAALGLVMAGVAGCGVLAGCGGSFLSLVLLLIYLGGMLVVFAYSVALAADPFPESWGGRSVVGYVGGYVVGVVAVSGWFWWGWYESSWVVVGELGGLYVLLGDVGGVAFVYSLGGMMLVVCAWVLLLTLLVVFVLARGSGQGVLRVA